jgi:hypothetical protein
MVQNSSHILAKNGLATGSNLVKYYGNSSYVVKKTEAAREISSPKVYENMLSITIV